MAGDLWALYRVTVDDVTTPAKYRVFCDLLERLQYEPMSLVRARQNGEMKLMGYSRVAEELADAIDHLRQLTATVIAVGTGAKRIKESAPYERRPGVGKRQPATLTQALAVMGITPTTQ